MFRQNFSRMFGSKFGRSEFPFGFFGEKFSRKWDSLRIFLGSRGASRKYEWCKVHGNCVQAKEEIAEIGAQ